MEIYKAKVKVSESETIDLPLTAQYDGDGNEITGTYATKTELDEFKNEIPEYSSASGISLEAIDYSTGGGIETALKDITADIGTTKNELIDAIDESVTPISNNLTTVSNNLTSLTNTYNSFISNQWNNRHFAYVGHYDTTTVNLALGARYMIVGAYQDSPPQLTLVNNSGGTTSIQLDRGVTVTDQRPWVTKIVTNGSLTEIAGTNEYPAAIRLTGGSAWNVLVYKLT